MAAQICAKLDRELDVALSAYAAENGLTRAQALREVLRQALTTADPVTRGWREGYTRGRHEVLKAHSEALDGIETQ